jgi:hypothetical protein
MCAISPERASRTIRPSDASPARIRASAALAGGFATSAPELEDVQTPVAVEQVDGINLAP